MKLFGKSEVEVIAEIHEAFDSAQERLLKTAQAIISKNVIPKGNLSDRLVAAGFTQTPTVQITKKKQKVLVENTQQAELIQYYKASYPFLKFLTEPELDRICDKYNLIHAPVQNFIGEVPEKNLRDIEAAQVLKAVDVVKDQVWTVAKLYDRYKGKIPNRVEGRLMSDVQFDRIMKEQYPDVITSDYCCTSITVHTERRTGLFICAPSKDFNLKGLTKKGKHWYDVLKTEVKDPIVYRYVRGGIQVITKWGLEASDPALVNEIMN